MTNDTRYDEEIEKRLSALFPRGKEMVTLASFQGRPNEAVLVNGENEHTEAAGLNKGDLIVALNGRRVYDMTQYIYLRSKLTDPSRTDPVPCHPCL